MKNPVYRTIDLQMVSETKSYTTAGEPLFYLYPLRFDNRLYYKEIGETNKVWGVGKCSRCGGYL